MSKPPRASRKPGQRFVGSSLHEHRRCWRNDDKTGFLEPVWPREPDPEIVIRLALEHLPANCLANHHDVFIAKGAFHRLYEISSPHGTPPASYLMRVAIPVEPFFKTESEVATMEYVRKHTSMPVPRVIAYESNTSNPLGFEWILMERAKGVTLQHVWSTMAWEDKLRLTEEMAHYMKQLLGLRFTLFGNIYFADVWNEVGYPPLSSLKLALPSPVADAGIGIDGEFVIGRMVSPRFFRDKRALLRVDRGPFEVARDLAMAETKLLGQSIRHLSPLPGNDYYCEVDQMLSEEADEVLQVYDKLENAVPRIFSHSDGPEDVKVLWHSDLSRRNILIDPLTCQITGVVDWESVSIVPAWETDNGMPGFLRGIEVSEPPPLGSLSEEEEAGLVEIRKDWELMLLRRKYAEIIGPLYDTSSVAKNTIERKTELSNSLGTFEDAWERTKYWLEDGLDFTATNGEEDLKDESDWVEVEES